MAKLKKRTPVKVPSDMERPIQQIYDDINDIINAVNRFHLEGEKTEGKVLNALYETVEGVIKKAILEKV